MINKTTVRVPKKYQHMIELIEREVGDCGEPSYWAYTEHGYKFGLMDCHTAHEDTQKDLLLVISSAVPCQCVECRGAIKEV